MEPINSISLDQKNQQSFSGSFFSTGRTFGIILLFQLAAGLTLPFILTKPITWGSPAYLTAVAEHSFQIRSAVLLSFVGSALTVWLGIIAFPILKVFSTATALIFLVVCSASCILDVVQGGTIMSMLAFSNKFVASGSAVTELYEVLGAAVASARRSAHSVQLLGISTWMFVLYMSMMRFNLIPRMLAVIGLVCVILQFSGVTLMMFIGYPSVGLMAMPLLPIQIFIGVWLIAKGFSYKPLVTPSPGS